MEGQMQSPLFESICFQYPIWWFHCDGFKLNGFQWTCSKIIKRLIVEFCDCLAINHYYQPTYAECKSCGYIFIRNTLLFHGHVCVRKVTWISGTHRFKDDLREGKMDKKLMKFTDNEMDNKQSEKKKWGLEIIDQSFVLNVHSTCDRLD